MLWVCLGELWVCLGRVVGLSWACCGLVLGELWVWGMDFGVIVDFSVFLFREEKTFVPLSAGEGVRG